MSDSNNVKRYPSSTAEVARMLKLETSSHNTFKATSSNLSAPNLPVADALEKAHSENPHAGNASQQSAAPVKNGFSRIVGNLYMKSGDAANEQGSADGGGHADMGPDLAAFKAGSPLKAILKKVIPYVVIFSVAVFVYFFFFSDTNMDFSKVLPSRPILQDTPKESALEQLQRQNLAGYHAWINQFYFEVTDPKVTDPNADNSGNGLTNFQKYLLNLNPKAYDTLGLGMADSEALSKGLNPSTGAKLTEEQQKVVDKYFDMETIINRLTLAHLQSSGRVAGSATASTSAQQAAQPAQTQLPNNGVAPNPFMQTQSANIQPIGNTLGGSGGSIRGGGSQTGAAFVQASNSTAENFAASPINASDVNIDQSKPGKLKIPSLKIEVPVMWTKDPKNFDKDLQSGVVHYPGTAMPGQIGTSYISGHSSNFAWAKGSYNRIFSKLGDLADNTSFSVTVYTREGKEVTLHYVVTSRQEFKATDQAQFQNFPKSVVALSTCWPIGTTQRRLVVFGELTQVEK